MATLAKKAVRIKIALIQRKDDAWKEKQAENARAKAAREKLRERVEEQQALKELESLPTEGEDLESLLDETESGFYGLNSNPEYV